MNKGRIILIGGGARSGKSSFALQRALALKGPRGFLATAEIGDEEMRTRVRLHQKERGPEFKTIEEPIEIAHALNQNPALNLVVLDCLTLWLSNLLLGNYSETDIFKRLDLFLEAASKHHTDLIIVTNEVGMGVVPPSPLGRQFRDLTGWAHQRLSMEADEIYWAVMGNVLKIKPSALLVTRDQDAPMDNA